jgi:Methylamine utilisation protein MauE
VNDIDPAAGLMIIGCFALLFGVAAVHKFSSLNRFTASLRAYDILPSSLIRPTSWALPTLELLFAIGLLTTVAREPATLGGALLLTIYATGIGINLQRERRELDCGCMGFGKRRTISAWMIWRNFALALSLLAVGRVPWGLRTLYWIDLWTVAGGICMATLLYMTIEGLLESSRRMPQRGRPV